MNRYKVSMTGYYIADNEEHALEQFYDEHGISTDELVANAVEGVCLTCSHPIEQHQSDGDGPCIALFCVCDVFHYNIGDCQPSCWGAE